MPTPLHIGARLKHIRRQQGLTLKQIEIKSRGKWKAVVIGSYERGTRSLSVAKAEELANFYGVPLSAFFTERELHSEHNLSGGLTFDLRKLRQSIATSDQFSSQVYDLLNWIARKREDWNGEILSLRSGDIDTLMILTKKNKVELADALTNRELWFTKQGRA
jgi:transcriptional regulator with XRE-family HTH domain